MKTYIVHRPAVEVVLLDTQRRPLAFTYKRLAMLQEMRVEFPELPVLCFVNHQVKQIPLETIELWDMRTLSMLNTSVV